MTSDGIVPLSVLGDVEYLWSELTDGKTNAGTAVADEIVMLEAALSAIDVQDGERADISAHLR